MTNDQYNINRNLYQTITRPTRIASHCANLIENIFTNNISNKTFSGTLFSDISDHLPVFLIYDTNYITHQSDKDKTVYIRVKSEESLNAFKKDLLAQNWDIDDGDVNRVFDSFLKTFKELYD